ncbi:MAG TPA: hemerythrin domain-containing protein [Bryobacteraceae bacterium]|nr:hemerythrin domain-containing protein [Bryobacteraceae bacterium]
MSAANEDGRTVNVAEQWQAIELQHELLFRIVGQLERAVLERGRGASTFELLNHLDAYVVVHFTTEETLMAHAEFPELDAHRVEHESLRLTVSRLDTAIAKNHHAEAMTLVQAIRDWAGNHSSGADIRLAEYLRRRYGLTA